MSGKTASIHTIIQAPVLEGDLRMEKEFGRHLTPSHRLERALIANLLHHLRLKGFVVVGVEDGGEYHKVHDHKDAMEIVFSVDEAWIFVAKMEVGPPRNHRILIVCGEGDTLITDYTFTDGDPDAFDKSMKDFDPIQEQIANDPAYLPR